MPYYQLMCVTAHFKEYTHIRELVRVSATKIMNSGGVVRNIRSWGTIRLLQRAKANKTYHHYADHWTMDFDTSPRMLSSLQSELTKDPRVIRWTTLKLGDRIQQITKSPEKTITRDMGPASLKQLGPGNQGIGGGLFERNQFTQSSNSWAP